MKAALTDPNEAFWQRHGANWLHWGPGPTVKAGVYTGDPGWQGADPTIVYHDNIIVGDAPSSVRDVNPELGRHGQK